VATKSKARVENNKDLLGKIPVFKKPEVQYRDPVLIELPEAQKINFEAPILTESQSMSQTARAPIRSRNAKLNKIDLKQYPCNYTIRSGYKVISSPYGKTGDHIINSDRRYKTAQNSLTMSDNEDSTVVPSPNTQTASLTQSYMRITDLQA
jgi:hypothetical protein